MPMFAAPFPMMPMPMMYQPMLEEEEEEDEEPDEIVGYNSILASLLKFCMQRCILNLYMEYRCLKFHSLLMVQENHEP